MNPAEVRVPGDKSISHRVLLLGALAEGTSVVRGLNPGEDVRATAGALRALGVPIHWDAGAGAARLARPAGFRDPEGVLDCRNSGTTARLLLGWLAGVGRRATLTGDASLRRRPMNRVLGPLRAMGAEIVERETPDRLPVEVISGVQRAGTHASPVASAQVKSALLLAGLAAGLPVSTSEPVLSRDHTERMLRAMGARVTTDRREDGVVHRFEPGPPLLPLDATVPGDLSAAAFWIAWALLCGRTLLVRDLGLNPTRAGALDALARMGARFARTDEREEMGEPVGTLAVEPCGLRPLRPLDVHPAEAPSLLDELPALAVLAARADGVSTVRGAGELRVKESDRVAALVENLRALGVEAQELPDGFTVRGTDAPLRGRVRTHGDHRIAMAFGVLGAQRGNAIELDDPACAAVSYPAFWDELRRRGAR